MDWTDRAERHARIEQLMERYRAAKQRRLVRLAMKLWRASEARQQIAQLDAPPDRIH